ncbi:MAG: ABC transporter permease [Planctomycetaceae bacterium]
MHRYIEILGTFLAASLSRDMTFRVNFLVECLTSMAWMAMNLAFYLLVFSYTPEIGAGSGWTREPFFMFIGTGLIINAIVQAIFMPSAEEFAEMVRTGGLDTALVKPIDAQFLLSLHRFNFSSLANGLVGLVLVAWGAWRHGPLPLAALILYPLCISCGVAILYSFITVLAAATVSLGRNQSLYDFWFTITNFSRYPAEIYAGPWGGPLRAMCTFVIPILLVVNVPARVVAQPLTGASGWGVGGMLFATLTSLAVSRWTFQWALDRYRSASS